MGYGMMHGWGFLAMVLFWTLVVALGIWLAGRLFPGAAAGPSREPDALEVLRRRYASGELTRDQYLQMKQDLEEQRSNHRT